MDTAFKALVKHCMKRLPAERCATVGTQQELQAKLYRSEGASFDAEQVILALPDRLETRQFFPAAVAAGFAWRVLRRVVQNDSVHPILIYQLCASCLPPAGSLSAISSPLDASPFATVLPSSRQCASPTADQSVPTSGGAGRVANDLLSADALSADGLPERPSSVKRAAPRQLLPHDDLAPAPQAESLQHLQQQERSQVGTSRCERCEHVNRDEHSWQLSLCNWMCVRSFLCIEE